MKPVSMLCLAGAITLLVTALFGVSSAMAEEAALCPSEEEECIAFTHVHEASAGKARMLNSVIKIECNVLFLGDIEEKTNTPLVIHGGFTYTECGSCTLTEENGPAELTLLKEGHDTAKVTAKALVKAVCSGVTCVFSGSGLEGTAIGSLLSTQEDGEISFQEQVLKKEKGLFCPEVVKLDVVMTPLSPTFIVEPLEVHALACVLAVPPGTGTHDDFACINRGGTMNYELDRS